MQVVNEKPNNGYVLSRDLTPRLVDVSSLSSLGRNARKHPARQVRKLRASLEAFGFVLPVVVDTNNRVVAGWGLVLAARAMGLGQVPAVVIDDLDEASLRSLRLALNRLTEDGGWDEDALRLEFSDILELDCNFDLGLTGFAAGEIDVLLDGDGSDEEDELPDPAGLPAITEPGDIWALGDHRVICGDSLDPDSYRRLLEGEHAQMVFSDPPYNVPIDGHVSGLGQVRHAEFAMASGEMTRGQFQDFLRNACLLASTNSVDGAIHYICMDWRHLQDLLCVAEEVYSELKNICVWNKTNGGMGSLYRSKHELVCVCKSGRGPHINNIQLGQNGRNRTNVWTYAGQTSLGGRKRKLSLHPTVKPVALVADAIRDCSNREGIILDPFGGAGTTLIAAERTGRRARLIEIEPRYVDAIVRRWENLTGRKAVRQPTTQPAPALPPDPVIPAASGAALAEASHGG